MMYLNEQYTEDNFNADMTKIAAAPTIQKWDNVCTPCVGAEPMANMEEIFYQNYI